MEQEKLDVTISNIRQLMNQLTPKLYAHPRTTGARIKNRRVELELTQQQLCDRLHESSDYIAECPFMSRSYLSTIECGHDEPSIAVLKAIAKELKVTLAYLLGEDQSWYSLNDEEKILITLWRLLK